MAVADEHDGDSKNGRGLARATFGAENVAKTTKRLG